MPFFGLWSSRGGHESVADTHSMPARLKPEHPILPADDIPLTLASIPEALCSKRRRPSIGTLESPPAHVAKRQKLADGGVVPDYVGAGTSAPPSHAVSCHKPATATDVARVREIINNEMGLEILLKHNELRLINQELAKCQIALEQLRRCSLIPYPVNCPTPDQALDVANGTGPALQCYPGEAIPAWAPPFGVVDGPYARHYAKWLIPDPKFDGLQVEFHIEGRRRIIEGRTTRNSYSESFHAHARRPVRGAAGQKLQSLSSGYPAKSDKSGPCTLVRAADGVRVKLVCVDCHRENFSSTQGFINHCRIAHKRDYKSHEEAAIHCGHPIASEHAAPAGPVPEEKPASVSYPGLVHPFARENIFDQETYLKLKSRIAEAISMVEAGVHPYCKSIPRSSQPLKADKYKSPTVIPSAQVPFLSMLAEKKGIATNMHEAVQEATRKVDEDDVMSDASEEMGELSLPTTSAKTAGSMRLPTQSSTTAHMTAATRPTSSKGCSTHMPFAGTHPLETVRTPPADDSQHGEDDIEVELSPNTLASNNAPSLVSDDGEYEDSEMMSDSEAGDNLEARAISDVPEITMEEEHDLRLMRHHRTASTAGPEETMRLPKGDVKHVTFVSPPIKSRTKTSKGGQRRGQI